MYYTVLGEKFVEVVSEAKEISGVIIVGALGIFTLFWGIDAFKRAVNEKYDLDNEADDYLAESDPDEYFAKYGADD